MCVRKDLFIIRAREKYIIDDNLKFTIEGDKNFI